MKTNSFLFAFLSAWLLLSNGTAYAQNIWYAAPTAAGNGNGMSWANASSLAIVLDSLAHAGDEVWVKQGRHKPVFDYSRKPAPQDPRTKQFTLPDGVRLYGGFAGNETLRTQRNWRTNITTLSGDLNGNDGANFANNAENVYHILLSVDSHLLTTLDGFSVSGGNADGSNTGYQVGNTWVAGENGAGIFALTSAMTIENCLFKSNKTIGSGGALSLEGSGLTMKNCEFSNNKAGYGGAISSNNSSNSTINRCVFQGNVSNYEGGALENYINSSPTVTNCLFINNTSLAGGAIENYSSAPTITNCTFTANNSQSGTGVYSQVSSAPTITNCIFWGNSTASACILDRNSVSTISYTTIQGTIAYAGVGNIRTDPMFLNIADLDGADNQFMTTDDGLQLGVCSYAIDGGTNSVLHTTDIVGTAIPVLATVDMGAYENTTNAALPAATITASSVGNIITGTSVTFTATPHNGAIAPYQWYVDNIAIAGANGASFTTTTLMDNSKVHCTITTNNACIPSNTINSNIITVRVCPNSTRFYVKPVASGLADGSSWANATNDLGVAIANACGISEIWVAAGVYKPSQAADGNKNPVNPRVKSFYLQEGVQLYGGFVGNETSLAQRPVFGAAGATTILSGDLNGDDAPNFVNNTENTYHVVVSISITDASRIDGFVITGGNATSVFGATNDEIPQCQGGGMYNSLSTIQIANCVFKENNANYIGPYSPFVYNGSGGGLFNNTSSPIIQNCVFTKNKALNGGGICNYFYNVLDTSIPYSLTNVSISENQAVNSGGGIFDYNGINIMNHCIINKNIAGIDGGGVFFNNNGSKNSEVIIQDNRANRNGGGMYSEASPNTLKNTIFINNKSQKGGGLYSSESDQVIRNCTFTINKATNSGSGIFSASTGNGIALTNCILWDSTTAVIHELVDNGRTAINLSFSIINDPAIRVGLGNTNRNPNFVDANNPKGGDNTWFTADDGLELGACSAAINTGVIDTAAMVDIVGVVRPQQGAVDMGAYESLTTPPLPALSIAASPSNQVFAGTNVTFTASPSTSTAPPYQWYLNGIPVGTNSATYTSNLLNSGDKIYCTATTALACAASPQVRSDTIKMATCPNGLVLYVKPVASGTGDGSSWANATADLQTAINNKCGITDIWVAAGTYLPTRDLKDEKAIIGTTKTFYMKDGIKLYGGFLGNETSRSQRNWQANPTILSGDLMGNDGPNFTNYADNVEHVIVSVKDTIGGITIDGFTIKGGSANFQAGYWAEGININSQNGSALYLENSILQLKNTVVEKNLTGYNGVMYNFHVTGEISTCIFRQDSTSRAAGAIYNEESPIVIKNTLFKANRAYFFGGAIVNASSNTSILNCVFDSNQSFLDAGGAIDNLGVSSPIITNNLFINNKTYNRGGAIENYMQADAIITNNTFINNTTTDTSSVQSNSIYNYSSNPTITNCVIWGSNGKGIEGGTSSHPIINYTLSDGTPLTTGVGNLNVNPLFADSNNPIGGDNVWFTADDGLRLMPCSSAVDAGTNSGSPLLDVLNNAVFNNIKDMGAYESQALCITNTNEPTGNAKLSVFPNPFSDKLSIYAENSNQSMEITDVFGHLLLTTVTVPPTIDLSHFASGVYFIRIGQETKKIVKMN